MTNLSAFLEDNGWANARSAAIAGDLSERTYKRLQKSGAQCAVLMESPVDHSLAAFVEMTHWLRDASLSAPEILGMNMDRGWLLLEDLGQALFSKLIRSNPTDQLMLYEVATDVLLHIRQQPPLHIDRPTVTDLVEATNITLEWYPNVDRARFRQIQTRLAECLEPLLSAPATVSLRDFHADNLIWMAEREGSARVGLLDYQDAFLTHPAYDLMSLLTDARIEVPPTVSDRTLRAYAEKSGDSLDELQEAIATLGVQRNLRILGVFFRAAQRDHKTHRLSAVPRVWNHLEQCLAHPIFESVRSQLRRALPEPPNL